MTIFRTASIFFPGKLAFKRKFSWKTGLPCLWHNMACFIVNSPQIFGNILKLFLWIRSTPPQFGKRTARGRWVDGSCSSVRMKALQRTAEKIVSSSPSCVSKRLVRSYVLKVHVYILLSVIVSCQETFSQTSPPTWGNYPNWWGSVLRDWLNHDRYIYIDTLYWLYAYIHRSSIFKSSSVKHIHQSSWGQMWFLLRSADIGPTGGGCPHGRGWSRVKWLSWLLNRCWFYGMINGHRF